MLISRWLRLLKVVERPTLVPFYSAGNNVRFNLHSKTINLPRYSCYSSTNIPIYNVQEWMNNLKKRGDIISRSRSTNTESETENFSENKYARDILINSKKGLKTFFIPFEPMKNVTDDEVEEILSVDWEKFDGNEILSAFEKVSSRASFTMETLDNKRNEEILYALGQKLSDLDDEKLRHVFRCLLLWKDTTNTNTSLAYSSLRAEMDKECINRLPGWSTEEALLMCDHWYQLKVVKKSQFPLKVLRKLGRKPKNLGPVNFLHFLFMINVCRKSLINMYEVEYYFQHILDEFTADELGIVSMGFFKSKTPFRDQNLIGQIHLKLIENLDNTQDVSISSIMKITRYSTTLKNIEIFQDLLHKLIKQIPRLSIPCLTNILHAAAFVQLRNPEFMKLAIEKYEKEIDKARIKDFERFCWVLSIFDYDAKTPIFEKIFDSIRDPKRAKELANYPTILPTLLNHLSHLNVFPIDLIKHCFDPAFLQETYGNNMYRIGWNYFSMENNLKIDLPEYDGPFLQPDILKFLSKGFASTKFVTTNKIRRADQFLIEVAQMCKTVLGSDKTVAIDQVLPHYVKSDIIICFDEKNSAVDPQPILAQMPDGTIKYPPADLNLKWITIILATQNGIIRGTNNLIGPMNCKIRQLKKIGYIPIVINFYNWNELPNEHKSHFLKKQFDSIMDRSVPSKMAI